jgi:hypothetical protein
MADKIMDIRFTLEREQLEELRSARRYNGGELSLQPITKVKIARVAMYEWFIWGVKNNVTSGVNIIIQLVGCLLWGYNSCNQHSLIRFW